MSYIFYTIIEGIYYIFIAFLISKFNTLQLINSSWILMFLSFLFSTSIFLLIRFIKDRKKYFIISSLYVIVFFSIFHILGSNILHIFNIKSGIINFTMYLYNILFMFAPLLSLWFVGLHKLIYKKQKKQLFIIIALRRISSIFVILLLMNFFKFYTHLYILSFIELIFNFLIIFC